MEMMGADRTPERKAYEAVVVGASAGGVAALSSLLSGLDRDLELAVLIVQHIGPQSDGYLARYLGKSCRLAVVEPDDKEPVLPGRVHVAPPNYHMMVEADRTVSLSIDARVNYSRPSIDVLFETAARVYGRRLIGIILSGANADGAEGLAAVKHRGGLTLVQSPESAEVRTMPEAAIRRAQADRIMDVGAMGPLLNQLGRT